MSANVEYGSLSLLVAVSVCRLFCGLAIVKSLSFILGPAEFGSLSQIIGVSTIFYSFAGGGVTTGLILYAGRELDPVARLSWLASALGICIAASLILAFFALGLFAFGTADLFGDAVPASVFVGIAIIQALMGIGSILLAYASGTGDLKAVAIANIIGALAWAGITVAATICFGYSGAVWSVILTPAATALIIVKLLWKPLATVWPQVFRPDPARAVKLLKASGLMLLAISALPIAQTILRADLATKTGGWHDVGLWQSISRLSDAYMQVFGVIAINLLLPRLLQRDTASARDAEMMRWGAAMLSVFVLGAAVLYALRDLVIRLAFSADFLAAASYVAPQLGADFAKVAAWILVYRFVASGHLWVQPAAEIFQALGLVVFYFALWPSFGAAAPVISHLFACGALFTGLTIAALRYRK